MNNSFFDPNNNNSNGEIDEAEMEQISPKKKQEIQKLFTILLF